MARHSVLRAVAGLLTAPLALVGCGAGDDESTGEAIDTVKIGIMGDLTGPNSALVIPPKNGAQLAIEEYNAQNPPVKIELVTYDSQGDPGQAVPLAQKAVVEDQIVGMIGPAFSGESKNVGPILEEARIPSVSHSATNPDLARNGWTYWHRVVANDAFQGPAIAEFLARAVRPTSAFVIDDRQEYGLGLADEVASTLTGLGVKTERDHIDPQGSDYSSTVNKVKAFDPSVIFYGGYYSQAGRLLKQLRDGGVQALFASGDGSVDTAFVEAAGPEAAEGAILGCPCLIAVGATEPALQKFAADYSARFGTDPAIYSTEGYDAATAFIKAIEAGNTSPEEINEFLGTLDFQGRSKRIKFQPSGENSVNKIFIHQVVNGSITLLGDSAEATLG